MEERERGTGNGKRANGFAVSIAGSEFPVRGLQVVHFGFLVAVRSGHGGGCAACVGNGGAIVGEETVTSLTIRSRVPERQ